MPPQVPKPIDQLTPNGGRFGGPLRHFFPTANREDEKRRPDVAQGVCEYGIRCGERANEEAAEARAADLRG